MSVLHSYQLRPGSRVVDSKSGLSGKIIKIKNPTEAYVEWDSGDIETVRIIELNLEK